MRRSPKL